MEMAKNETFQESPLQIYGNQRRVESNANQYPDPALSFFPTLTKVSTNRPGPMRFTMSGFMGDRNMGSRSTESYHNTGNDFSKNRTVSNWDNNLGRI